MQRLLITGGTGYLGQELLRQALMQGWYVAASYFSQAPPDDTQIVWFPLDIRDAHTIEEALASIQPDVVIHTAFRQNDPYLWSVTAAGTRNVAQAVRRIGIQMIHLSSDVIFDGERNNSYTAQDPPDPITPYGIAKADAERFVQEQIPDATIVRTSLIYGFHPVDRHTQFVLDIADGSNDASLFTDEYRCPIFVGDLAAALLELVHLRLRGIINVAGSECVSRYTFGTLLAQAYGRDPTGISSGLSTTGAVRRPRNCCLDINVASTLLHTRLRGVREVLSTYKPASPT